VATGAMAGRLAARHAPLDAETEIRTLNSPLNLLVTGAILLQTNRFEITANFARTSSLPQQARISCASFSIPARLFNLENYSDVKGALSFLWSRSNFVAELGAHANPVPDSKLPPLDV